LRDDRLNLDRIRDSERDVYLVLNDFGRAWCETAEADTESPILIRWRFGSPVRIIAVNTAAGSSRDVIKEIALEPRQRCSDQGEVPQSLQTFLSHHGATRLNQNAPAVAIVDEYVRTIPLRRGRARMPSSAAPACPARIVTSRPTTNCLGCPSRPTTGAKFRCCFAVARHPTTQVGLAVLICGTTIR